MKTRNDAKMPALVVTIELKLWRMPDGTGDSMVSAAFDGESKLVVMLSTSATGDALDLVVRQFRDTVLEHIGAVVPMRRASSRQIGRA